MHTAVASRDLAELYEVYMDGFLRHRARTAPEVEAAIREAVTLNCILPAEGTAKDNSVDKSGYHGKARDDSEDKLPHRRLCLLHLRKVTEVTAVRAVPIRKREPKHVVKETNEVEDSEAKQNVHKLVLSRTRRSKT